MSTITTVEELEALDVGTSVIVQDANGDQTWTRSIMGLDRNGSSVETRLFSGAVSAGHIRVGSAFTVGTWVESGDHAYYVYDVDGEEYRVIHFYSDFSVGEEVARNLTGTPSTEPPEKFSNFAHTARVLANQYRLARSHSAETRLNAGRVDVDRLTVRLGEILTDFHNSDDREALSDVMQEFDLELPSRAIDFTIEVSGTTTIELDADDLQRHLSGVMASNCVDVEVEWSHTIDWSSDYPNPTGDPCEDTDFIDDDWVRERLGELGQSYDSFEITSRRCSGC